MRADLTPEQEKLALGHDPFEGDETDATKLSAQFVNGRKQYECFHCCDPIEVGDRHLVRRDRNHEEGRIDTWRWCGACAGAMASYEDTGEDDPLVERLCIGNKVRDERHKAALVAKGGL